MPSAPVKTDESLRSGRPPHRAGNGELPAPAPPSQPLDGGAGAGISFVEAEAGGVDEGEDGAEGKSGIGSWRGRLTARDKELVSHLGLVRYLRTDQIAELVFPGRAQSVISGRLGELSQRHGRTRALIKKLWFVNSEGKRVLVWALTPSGYALAGEQLGRQFKVPRHDVAHQFLEHATGVNDLYVALTKKAGPPRPAPRGKPADDFARVPSAFRWVATEDLELPFSEYVAKPPDHVADRRLQPDAMLEDLIRKRRYLIEFETGSATVRNAQHNTATLTKIGRYSNFLLGPTQVSVPQTYYSKHFNDGYKPVVVFLTRTEARRDTIVKVAEEYWGAVDARFELRALTMAEAGAEFRARLLGETPRPPSPDLNPPRVTKPATLEGTFISFREIDLLKRFQEESLQIIQRVRHTVRAGKPVTIEPRYPELMNPAAMVLQRLLR